MAVSHICDKCGKVVSPDDDAGIMSLWLQLESDTNVTSEDLMHYAGIIPSRHLAPKTKQNNGFHCEGSPSRWRYIANVQDYRGEYTYDTSIMQLVQTIYHAMQTDGLFVQNKHMFVLNGNKYIGIYQKDNDSFQVDIAEEDEKAMRDMFEVFYSDVINNGQQVLFNYGFK